MKLPTSVLEICGMCDVEAIRYALGAVQLSQTGEKSRAAATNGRAAIVAEWEGDGEAVGFPALVPLAACHAVLRAWKPKRGTTPPMLGVTSNEKAVTFKNASKMEIKARNAEGSFPAIEDAFDAIRGKGTRIRLDLRKLTELVQTLNAMVPTDACEKARVTLIVGEEKVVLSVSGNGLNIAGLLIGLLVEKPEKPVWLPGPAGDVATVEPAEDPEPDPGTAEPPVEGEESEKA